MRPDSLSAIHRTNARFPRAWGIARGHDLEPGAIDAVKGTLIGTRSIGVVKPEP